MVIIIFSMNIIVLTMNIISSLKKWSGWLLHLCFVLIDFKPLFCNCHKPKVKCVCEQFSNKLCGLLCSEATAELSVKKAKHTVKGGVVAPVQVTVAASSVAYVCFHFRNGNLQ